MCVCVFGAGVFFLVLKFQIRFFEASFKVKYLNTKTTLILWNINISYNMSSFLKVQKKLGLISIYYVL